jgi:hypothetical protein
VANFVRLQSSELAFLIHQLVLLIHELVVLILGCLSLLPAPHTVDVYVPAGKQKRLLLTKRSTLLMSAGPTIEAKETHYRGKRDLPQRQKRPTIEAKETYYRGKRDLP